MAKSEDSVKKMGLVGLGLALLTKEQVDRFMKQMVNKGGLSSAEAKKKARQLISRSKKEKTKLDKAIQNEVQKNLKKMNIATKSDIKKLEKKISKKSKKKSSKKASKKTKSSKKKSSKKKK
ncbi:polyhydroxyalkanoate synthesis regulator [Candidatus Woesearchaeota archaeon]|nr:polyhydroxyalkanoate synthesis regulator [Candidatus Woesearchaeota archaeon]